MTEFIIDNRLLADSFPLLEKDGVSFLLHRNAEVSWFILVPHVQQNEFYQLDLSIQHSLFDSINRISSLLKSELNSEKINLASIGNIVSQLHFHVVGRRSDDAFWPDVVWGKPFRKTYDASQLSSIRQLLQSVLQ